MMKLRSTELLPILIKDFQQSYLLTCILKLHLTYSMLLEVLEEVIIPNSELKRMS